MTVYHPLFCISHSSFYLYGREWIFFSVWGHHFLHTLTILNKKGLIIPMESTHILRTKERLCCFFWLRISHLSHSFSLSMCFNANKSIIYNIYHLFYRMKFVFMCAYAKILWENFQILSHLSGAVQK